MGLTIICFSESAIGPVETQVRELIGGLTEIRCFSYGQILKQQEKVKDDLVLITATDQAELIAQQVDSQTKIIIAKRIINPKMIWHLFGLDPEKKGLVVNYQVDNSLAMISEIKAMGIRLNLTPYDPENDMDAGDGFEYAITPGYPMLVPGNIKKIIDVGHRLLSLLTIGEVLHHFSGNKDYEGLVFSRYIRDFIDLSREVFSQNNENYHLKSQMENLITHFEFGVILANGEGEVLFHNKAATDVLGTKSIAGLHLHKLLPSLDINRESSFLKLGEKTIHVTQELFASDEEHDSRIFILEDIAAIRSVDEQYRSYEKSRHGYRAKHHFRDFVFQSQSMASLIVKARRFARTNSSVLIHGDSGTGKELFAQAIHNESTRAKNPFVAINCAALSESLLESELFGYEPGSFTGALKSGKPGLLEQAHTGTIFLDEIGDAPFSIQTKLLRALQEREIMRISGNKVIPIDVRVIAATNKNLKRLVADGSFRHDLYFRINVLPIHIPPLSERKEDVSVLLDYFISFFAKQESVEAPSIPQHIRKLLLSHTWNGNVREIMNAAEYLITTLSLQNDAFDDFARMLTDEAAPDSDEPQARFSSRNQERECRAILAALSMLPDDRIPGRKQLVSQLDMLGCPLSEQQIKTRLELMGKLQLIRTSQGRSAEITERGRLFMDS